MFGLLLIGTKGLARGGFVLAVLSAAWLIFGLVIRQAKFPVIMLVPLGFFLMMVVNGFQLFNYPSEYILRMVTIWIGAIALASFIASGVSINLVIAWLAIIVIANIAAIMLGYDSKVVNTQDFSVDDLQRIEIERYSGLAGHQNVLMGIAFALPFSLFFLKTRISTITFFAVCISCVCVSVLTGSRTGVVFTAVFLLFGSFFLLPKGMVRLLVILTGVASIIAAALLFNGSNTISKIENSSLGDIVIVKRVIDRLDDDDGSGTLRDAMKSSVTELYSQKPLAGHGPGMFKEVGGFDTYAHNNFVELTVNFGLIGIISYYVMYGLAALGIVLAPGRNIYLLAPLVFLFLADNWYVTYVNRAMALCLCIMLMLSFTNFTNKSRRRRSRRRRR